jgi:hypothetical protein
VSWETLNIWLSLFNGNKHVAETLPEGLDREKVLKELEKRRKKKLQGETPAQDEVQRDDPGYGTDWRTARDMLLIYQPQGWREQALVYMFRFKNNLARKSRSNTLSGAVRKSINQTLDICLENENLTSLCTLDHIVLATPVLLVFSAPRDEPSFAL